MYIFDTNNASDGSYIDRSTSGYSVQSKQGNNQDSVLKGPDFNFPKKYPKTLSRALSIAAETSQSIVFLDDRGEEKPVTYKKLKQNAEQVLASLQIMGIQPGKAVVLQLDGLEEFLTSFWACILGGLVPVPVLPFRNASIEDGSFRKLQTIVAELDHPFILMADHNAELIEKAKQDEWKKSVVNNTFLNNATITTFSEIEKCDQDAVIFSSKSNDIAFLQYTSGSTSFPKGTQITNANVLATVQSMILALEVDESSVMLNWMPYYHDMGIIAGHIMAVVSCCKVIAMRPFTFVRRPIWWLEKIAEHRVSITFSPNFGLKRIIEKCNAKQLTHLDLSCLKVILNGAEPISIQTSQRFIDFLHTHCAMPKECLTAGYGMAEASLAVSISPLDEVMRTHVLNREKLGCGDKVEHVHAEDDHASLFADEGPAVAGMEIRIVDKVGEVLPLDTVGHVEIKGESVTAGYFANDLANKNAFNGKWFRTGDLGFIYDGRFIITGRVKDVIFVNGQNFYSHDFEHSCEEIDGLERLVVLGYFDHERNEEDLIAFVVCNSKYTGAREKTGVLRATQMRINQCFDVAPTMFVMLKSTGEIPKTTSGKIMRHKLLENYIEGNFSNQCIHISELLEIVPDLSREPESGKHVTIAEFELLIRSWWSEVLGISDNAIGDHDPFYSLGGTSIKAIEVLALAEESVDCVITHDMFKEHDTIHGLASFIVRENVTVRCKTNKLVKLAPYREDKRKFDIATEQVKLDVGTDDASATVSYITPDVGENDIAIIGMGCVFPHADDIEEFWQVLKQGKDCISEFPSDRCNINEFYSETSDAENTTVSKWGSFIENHHFDPKFFSINENEALTMDPHQRVFLNAAWQAVQDSGLTNINGTNMGVFVGASGTGFYQQREKSLLTPSTLTGALANLAAARVSNAFNLKGPSLSVDTACSSSLVSVDLAVKSILNGESDTAIAGGVQVIESIVMYLMFSRAGILSPEGKCFTFDNKANGFVPGEGAGAVILKRYSEAISDGDRVYAVIKGSATNNDGASLGIMSPNPEGQENIIRTALKQSKVNPEDIGYVEAHGTGTSVGDLIEVRSLSLAFNEKNEVAKQSCAIGSVKTNMGHQLAAAGIAGLMKAALTVYHKEIPATLNCDSERKELKLKDTPFYVNHKTKPWPDNGKRRLAAVNSFGFGGTNAHVILSNAYHTDIQYPTVTNDDEPLVYCLSAKTELSLDVSKDVFADHVVKTSNRTKDVAHTYSARRDHYRQNRLAIVANSLQDAAAVARGEKVKYASIVERKNMSPARSRVAWMFSGQGSQHPAMAKTLYKNEPVFKDIIDRADEIASPLLGVSLRDLLLTSSDLKEVSATELTQPLVFTMDYALACLWKSWGIKPDFMMGHSIGEYVAACIAEVFTFEDALKVVVKRGALMATMPSGCGMTAVLLSANDTEKTLEALNLPLDIAAFNGPASTVVSGKLSILKQLHKKLDEQKSVYQPLSVSHAFHSRHMEPMLDEFRKFLSTIMMRMPTMPIVSNVTGELIEAGDIDSDYWSNYWVNHIRQPVQFHKGVEFLIEERTKVFIEVGAQEHLAGLARRIVNTDKLLVVTSLPKMSGADSDVAVGEAREATHIAKTKAQLYTYGVDIDWAKYYALHGDRRLLNAKPGEKVERRVTKNASVASVKMVSVPTYSLERRSMFRLVGGANYPFKHLFNKVAEAQFSYVPDANCVLFKDHVVCKMPMLSGAGQCDLISHLYAQNYKLPPKSLRNLSFHQPWLEKSQLSIAFKGEEEKEFSVIDARGNVVFKGFADALTKEGVESSVSIELIEKQLPHHYSQTEVYDIFSSCGVEYGPFHRSIVDLKASPTQALARLKPATGNAASWQHGHYLHPGILDCAFQAAAGILMAELAESNKADEFPTMVPLGIESINNYKCLQEAEYYSHVVLCADAGDTAGSDIISCDVTVYDLNGEPCASIKKLQLKRLPAMMTAGAAKKKSVQQTAAQQVAPQVASQAVHQAAIPEQKTAQLLVQEENTAAAEFFQFQWLETTLPQSPLTEQTCIFFGSSNAIEQQFAPAMAALGVNAILIPYEHYSTLDEAGMLAILEKIDTADSIVYLGDYAGSHTDGNDVADMANMRCLFNLVKSLSKASRNNKTFKKIQLIRVTQNAIPLNVDDNKFDIRKSLVTGFLRSVRIEFPLLNVRQVSFAEMSASDAANKLAYELSNTNATPECLYSATKRFDYSVQPVDVNDQYKSEDVFNKAKVFWIIGGTSGVGQLLAHHIASNYKSNLVLSGSRQLPAPSAYDKYLSDNVDNSDDSIANTIKSIREIEALGSKVTYVRTDVRSTDSQRLSLEAIRKVHKHIDGIYFSALQLDDKMVLQKEWTGYRNMIDMRVNGLQALINQTQNEAMDFFIMFSSVASITGNLGQSDYSASSVYMDNVPYAQHNTQQAKNGCRYITVQWGAWELGQQVSDIVLEHMTRSGFVHITADAGMQALEKIILSGEKNLAYVPGSLNASQIASSINGLRQGLSSKPKKKVKPINEEVIMPVTPSAVTTDKVEEQHMSNNNPVVSGNASDGQIQLLMNEFDKQRDMLMKLCDSQNVLLANTLGSSGLAQVQSSPPQTIQPTPQIVESAPQPAVVESIQQPVAEMFQAAEPVPVEPEAAPAVAEQSVSPEISVAASQERPTDVFEYVKGLMAKAVEMDRDDIDPDQNIMELGADSMTAMSMVKDMETLYDIELPATLLFEYSTLNELVDFLKEEIGEG